MRLAVNLAAAMVVLVAATGAWAQDDEAAEGGKVFKRSCFICHAAEAGKNKVGPSLFGVVGRKAASEAGFSYSQVMKSSGIVWDEQKIDQYIADPKTFLSGTKMVFFGVKKPEERKELIAYLKTLH